MLKYLLLLAFLIVQTSLFADDELRSERAFEYTEHVIEKSKALRQEVAKSLSQERAVASLAVEDAEWVEYWQELMNEPTEDPTYWLNKVD